MQVTEAENSWWNQSSNKVESSEEKEIIEQKQPDQIIEEEDKTSKEDDLAVDKTKDNIVVEDETPKVVEAVSDFFETLKTDTKYNFAFDADTKLNTYDEIADFVDLNVKLRYEDAIKTIDNQWYQSKPPAFQQFAQMAELAGNDINKVYDLINTQKTIDDYENFNTDDEDQAELIVTNYLKLRDEPKEVIEIEIADLKERGLLNTRAEKYKPLLITHFEGEKQAKIKQEEENLQTFYKTIEDNEKQVVNFLSAPIVSGMNLKDEDKDIVYSNLVFDPNIGGFNIYKKVEELQKQGKFEQLAKAILILENEARFDELYSSRIKQEVSQKVRRNIRFANDVSSYESKEGIEKQANSKKEEVIKPFSYTS